MVVRENEPRSNKEPTKKKVKQNTDDIWYGGWKKYREGAGAILMNKGIKKYNAWKVANPDASPKKTNEFLNKLCKVNLLSRCKINRLI